jgi:hypothetical protein
VSEADPFIGQIGFSCNSNVGQMLITSFETSGVVGAIFMSWIQFMVILSVSLSRQTKAQHKSQKTTVAYDIAWEHTSLGDISISSSYLLNSCLVGLRILKV